MLKRRSTTSFAVAIEDTNQRDWSVYSSNDALACLLQEIDLQRDMLQTGRSGLVDRARERLLQLLAQLDALIDDALYSGDADVARRCSEHATALRDTLGL
jgi:hypothetical protein